MVAQWQAELDRLADKDELEQKLAAAIQAGTPRRLEARVLWNAAALEEKLGESRASKIELIVALIKAIIAEMPMEKIGIPE